MAPMIKLSGKRRKITAPELPIAHSPLVTFSDELPDAGGAAVINIFYPWKTPPPVLHSALIMAGWLCGVQRYSATLNTAHRASV